MSPSPDPTKPDLGSGPGGARVKICGVTRVEDASAALAAGADWIGLNFHPPSPRCVSEERARELVAEPDCRGRCVGVFVDRNPEEIAALCRRLGIGVVQLHGDEPTADLRVLAEAGLKVVKAFRVGAAEDIALMSRYLRSSAALGARPDAVLVDSFVPGVKGGSGKAIPAQLVGLLPPSCSPSVSIDDPGVVDPRIILAGGLNPANVARAIERMRPWMVDVAGGVESAPGIKDHDKMFAFIEACRLHA